MHPQIPIQAGSIYRCGDRAPVKKRIAHGILIENQTEHVRVIEPARYLQIPVEGTKISGSFVLKKNPGGDTILGRNHENRCFRIQ